MQPETGAQSIPVLSELLDEAKRPGNLPPTRPFLRIPSDARLISSPAS